MSITFIVIIYRIQWKAEWDSAEVDLPNITDVCWIIAKWYKINDLDNDEICHNLKMTKYQLNNIVHQAPISIKTKPSTAIWS